MIKFFKQSWWKILSLLLLVYVFIGGMLLPLGPGITSVAPYRVVADSTFHFSIKGYNTHFLSAKNSQQLWVKTGLANYYKVNNIQLTGDQSLSFDFGINSRQLDTARQTAVFDVVVNNDIDGTVTLRDAFVVAGSAAVGDSTINAVAEKPIVKHNSALYMSFPYREILYESIRNTFYHVPMWFAMLFLLLFSVVYSIRYLATGNRIDDIISAAAVYIALLFGTMGIFTGMMWANYTWGEPWPNDVKLNGAAIGMLIYLAYAVLRGSLSNEIQRAKICSVYNIFAIVIYILFIFIIPRINDSLHPGNGGNPAFSKYDLDSTMRMFFYPAVIGWVLFSLWLVSIRVRMQLIANKQIDRDLI